MQNLWVPAPFRRQPPTQLEETWEAYSPLGWEALWIVAIQLPVALPAYVFHRGYAVLGAVGFLLWVVALWLILVRLHNAGRFRIWLSAIIAVACQATAWIYAAGYAS